MKGFSYCDLKLYLLDDFNNSIHYLKFSNVFGVNQTCQDVFVIQILGELCVTAE